MSHEIENSEKSIDGKAGGNARSAKLQSLLNKIKKNNNDKTSSTGDSITVKGKPSQNNESHEKFTLTGIGDVIVGEDIVKKRFKNGHLLNLKNGVVDTTAVDS